MNIIKPTAIIALLFLHIILGGIQVAFGGVSGVCEGSDNPLCGTPVQDFRELGRSDPMEKKGIVGRLPIIGELAGVWKVVQVGWTALVGAFTVNYAWLNESDTYIGRLMVFVLQSCLGAVAASWLFSIGIQAIGRR